MNNYEAPYGVIFGFIAIALFTSGMVTGMVMGSEISETGNITQGRNQGIIFCTEKPKECKIEYTYLKLKSNQK